MLSSIGPHLASTENTVYCIMYIYRGGSRAGSLGGAQLNKESVSPACKDTRGRNWNELLVSNRRSIEDDGGMETEITNRVGSGWINWNKCRGVLSISIWDRTMCCNEATRKTNRGKRDEDAMVDWM